MAAAQDATLAKPPMDRLQSMVNFVLVETGKAFIEISKRQKPQIELAKEKLKNSINASESRYHLVLDEMDKDLQLAKMALRRDLALLKASRLQREKAEAAEKERVVAESSAMKLVESQQANNGVLDKKEIKLDDDVIMVVDDEPAPPNFNDNNASRPSELTKSPETNTHQLEETSTAHHAISISTQNLDTADATVAETFDQGPDTSAIKDIDFDSLFDDPENNSELANDSITSPTAANTNDLPTTGDIDFTLDSDTGPSSLLPGLESYTNISDPMDTSIISQPELGAIDLTGTATAPQALSHPAAAVESQEGGAIGSMNGDTGYHDSTFDDLFDDLDDGGDGTGAQFDPDDWINNNY